MDWMGQLPFWMHNYPISRIAIPGSHDTGTFSLDPNGPFAPDQPKTLAKILATFSCFARPIVYRWSVTQSLDYDDQLASGIRYFDLRISTGPNSAEYSVVHGLFGSEIVGCLKSVKNFSQKHSSEIVILDMNHFYNMKMSDHNALIHIIIQELGDLLISAENFGNLKNSKKSKNSKNSEKFANLGNFTNFQNLGNLTLAKIWEQKGRIFCIYQNEIAHFFPKFVWCAAAITSPWPNVTETRRLINFLDSRYEFGPQSANIFYGTQGILTPSAISIIKNPVSSLRTEMSFPATDAVLKWIRRRQIDNWFNIVLADFSDFQNFTSQIIALNRTKTAPAIFSLPFVFENFRSIPTKSNDTKTKNKSRNFRRCLSDPEEEPFAVQKKSSLQFGRRALSISDKSIRS